MGEEQRVRIEAAAAGAADWSGSGRSLPQLYQRLEQTASIVESKKELAGVIDAILEEIVGLGAMTCELFLAEPERRVLFRLGARHPIGSWHQEITELSYDEPWIASRVAVKGEVMVEPLVGRTEPLPPNFVVGREGGGAASLTSIPLKLGERLVGVITTTWDEALSLAGVEHRALEALGRSFARALANALSHERLLEVVAKRKRAESELLESREGLRHTFENAPVGLAIWGLDGRFVKVNRAYASLIGFEPEELVGVHAESLALKNEFTWERPLYQRLLEGKVSRLEYGRGMIRRDGSIIQVRVSASLMRDASGGPLRFLGAVEDITERVQAARELEQHRKEWVSVVAHELRQPLTAIMAHSGLLLRGELPADVHSHVAHIQAGGRALKRMIDDLLEGSLLEANHFSLELREIDVSSLVWLTVERRSPHLEGREIVVRSGEELPKVNADPERIEQVLSNLLINAWKYGAPEAPIEIGVRAKEATIEVWVANEGEGIPADELPLIFERFHRSPGGGRRQVAGLGLGLHIAKGLVDAHGGRIWATSEPGGRTTFTFSLPVPMAGGGEERAV